MVAATLIGCSVSSAQLLSTFEQRLQRRVSVTWQGQELAAALERLTSAGQITLWLDRRVDRQLTVTAEFVDIPLAEALEKTAQQQSLGFTRLASIAYIGPQQTALELSALTRQARDQLRKLPATVRKRWLRAEATTWPRLSEPRQLAESWLREADIRLIGSEQITHDLWPAQSLPPLALVDRLVLLLAGFDWTCKISSDGKSCEIVPITRPLKPASQPPAISTPLKKSRQGKSHQHFTLRLENQPLGRVLDQLAKQLRLEVVWAIERKKPSRERLVSCDVQNVGLDKLLQSVLSPAGLQHQRLGKQVTIRAKPD